MRFEDFEEKTIVRKEIYDGKIIKVAVDKVELPNNAGTSYRELVFHPGGVCVVPITKEGKIVLVEQFRKPLEKVILEIPAGKLEKGEAADLENAAKRELEEETGYKPGNFYKLTETVMSPGFCDEELHIYMATDIEKVENPREMDEDEVIVVYELTLEEAKQAKKDGRICDAKTEIGLMAWEMELLRKANQ